jgi:hypothetical protein
MGRIASAGRGEAAGHWGEVFRIDNLLRFAAVAAQVVLIALLFKAVRLESAGFRQVVMIAAVAFPINHLLPIRFRLPFFVTLSCSTTLYILGAPGGQWMTGVWLLGLGLLLIGACHVPAPMGVRVGLVAALAGLLALFRADWITAPWPSAIWPLLGAMFMFRMIGYLYDLVHKSAPFSFWRSLAYFFMIPNVCFPLFPVVDYQTFCRTYYNEDAFKTYQTGVKWMLRGAIQLILYRFIYKFLIVGPAEIEGASGFFQHMVCTYLLYLQVSGLFHTIIGLLHLFGFNLPETNHHWALASSFTDFWRRINIYWKDFIMKVFFYPLYFRLRKLGNTRGMVLATLIAFFATWALHAYQWFWIRGAALFTVPDIIFWLVLGVLVTVSVWNESRPTKKLVPKTAADSAKLAAILAAKTVATFLSITLLWSLWTAGSMAEWQATLLQWQHWSLEAVLKIVIVLGILATAAIVIGRDQWQVGGAAKARAAKARPYKFWTIAATNLCTGVIVLMLFLSEIQSHMPARFVAILGAIEDPGLNAADAAEMQRGYYEDLIQVDRFNPELQALYQQKPQNYFVPWRQAMNHQRDDYLGVEMSTSASITYEGVSYSTNEWGMRDKSYPKEKPAGVYRIGILGSSHMMGWGVADDQTAENVAEARLAAEGQPYELLNFSVNGYDPIQKAITLNGKMAEFDLDAVFMFCHRIEKQWLISHLVNRVRGGRDLPDPFLEEIVKKAGVDQNTDEALAKIRLSNYGSEMMAWAFDKFAKTCRDQGIKPIFVFMPEMGRVSFSDRDVQELFDLAKASGFELVEDFSRTYDGVSEKELQVASYDDHPNARAHALLAEQLYQTITKNKAVFTP